MIVSDESFWSYLPFSGEKNYVSSFSQSTLIGSLSNLQVMSTGIKAQTSSNLGRIGLFTLELFALEHRFLIFNPRGYIHVLNHEHNCIKSDFKEISLKGPGMIWAIFGPHLEIHQLLFFSRLIFILSLKMKNGYVPTCYLEVIAISDFIHFPLSRRQFVGVGIYLAKSFHIK